MILKYLLIACFLFCGALSFESEAELADFLENFYEQNVSAVYFNQVEAEWAFNTDVNNKDKEQNLIDTTLKTGELEKFFWETYFRDLNEDDYVSENIKRQVMMLKVLGNAALDTDKLSQLTSINTNMTNIYSAAKICPFDNQNCNLESEGLTLEPGIEAVISKSTNYKELEYVWAEWHKASGAKIKEQYKTYVELSNEAAVANGFKDKSELWQFDYETENFEEHLENLWQQVMPLYAELHKFVANKLKERYGDEIDISDGLIPAHVLGNMWAQSWVNLIDLVKPYPDASSADVTKALNDQGYTPLKMFETSNEFYLSLGLDDCAISYNTSAGAVITKPPDRDILCHASAWDFYDEQNYRAVS